jgi:hypothetical protein
LRSKFIVELQSYSGVWSIAYRRSWVENFGRILLTTWVDNKGRQAKMTTSSYGENLCLMLLGFKRPFYEQTLLRLAGYSQGHFGELAVTAPLRQSLPRGIRGNDENSICGGYQHG